MKVLRDFRRIADALERLVAHQKAVLLAETKRLPSTDRLDALELSRSQFEAEMEGLLLRAEGKLKAAANAEARERTMSRKRHEEADVDPFPDDREEIEEALPGDYAAPGFEEELHPLHLGLEKNSKAYALRAKYS